MTDKSKIILKPNINNTCGKSYNLLNVKLLNECNGKCSFCIAAGTPHKQSSPYESFVETINSLSQFSKVDILGGEPTLYKDLVNIVRGIRPYKKEIGIISNASNLQVLIDCLPYIDSLTLSIHSFNYSKNPTGIIVDEKKLSELNRCKNNVETIAATVISTDTISDLNEIKKYADKAKQLGFSAIKLMELITSNEDINFIDLQDLLKNFNIHQKNATLKGCFFELPELSEYLGIKTYIKLCCPYNNIFKAKDFGIPEIEYQHDYINVVQPDCTVTDSWVYESFENKILNGGKYNVNYLEK